MDRVGDRYLITGKPVEGLDCLVYRATDERSGATVAVKVPVPDLMDRQGFREAYERELRAQLGLEHPHLARIQEVGDWQGKLYAVLPHLSGGSLEERIRGRRLAAREVAGWLGPVAEALDFLHARGLTHLQVRPETVLFDADGAALLSDFGIAKVLLEIPPPPTLVPRPHVFRYASPEHCMGVRFGPASDQYSLAAVVYEALSGRLPHEAPAPFALVMKKMQEPPAPLGPLVPGLPSGAAAAVMRALAIEPRARFASCLELAQAFQAGLEGVAPAETGLEERAGLPDVQARFEADRPLAHVGAGGGVPAETSGEKRRRALIGLGHVAASLGFCALYLLGGRHGAFPLAAVLVPALLSVLCGASSRSSALSFLTGFGPVLVALPWLIARSSGGWLLESVALVAVYLVLSVPGVFASAVSRRLKRRLDALPPAS